MTKKKIEFFQDKSGNHRFRLRAGNGEIIATSEGYVSRSNATRGLNDLLEFVQTPFNEIEVYLSDESPASKDERL